METCVFDDYINIPIVGLIIQRTFRDDSAQEAVMKSLDLLSSLKPSHKVNPSSFWTIVLRLLIELLQLT